jgi:carbon-monoxide dehydrogenase medium subunit
VKPALLLRPSSVDEAVAILAEHGEAATLLAGGQSLVPMMSAGLLRPQVLVDLGAIVGVEPFGLDGEDVVIGLGCTHRQLERAPAWFGRAAPLVVAAAPWIATPPIRNRGTFIGSVAHGDPSSEWPAVAVALDAVVEIASSAGRRTASVHDFLLGPLATSIETGEMVVAVRMPRADTSGLQTGVAVAELAYRHGDYAVVGVVAQLALDDADVIRQARLAVFGIGDIPWRAREVEAMLEGAPVPDLAAAGELAAELVTTVSDATAGAGYRRRMTGVMSRRALQSALTRATSAGHPPAGDTDGGTRTGVG